MGVSRASLPDSIWRTATRPAGILVLDDDITIAMDIRMQLHALGHTMAGHATHGCRSDTPATAPMGHGGCFPLDSGNPANPVQVST